MRVLSPAVALGALLLLGGCTNDSKWGFLRNSRDTTRLPSETPTTVQLVGYLNQNAQKVRSLECLDLDLDCHQGLQSFGLRGKLVCEQPHKFRLIADALGNRAVDMGSNDQEFWYWISKAEPPYLVHCSYEDLKRGTARMPFPFQP